jgi:hypothetical protein
MFSALLRVQLNGRTQLRFGIHIVHLENIYLAHYTLRNKGFSPAGIFRTHKGFLENP